MCALHVGRVDGLTNKSSVELKYFSNRALRFALIWSLLCRNKEMKAAKERLWTKGLSAATITVPNRLGLGLVLGLVG